MILVEYTYKYELPMNQLLGSRTSRFAIWTRPSFRCAYVIVRLFLDSAVTF